jgi:hypothetical protein
MAEEEYWVGSSTKTEKEEVGIISLACIWQRQLENDNRIVLRRSDIEDRACL